MNEFLQLLEQFGLIIVFLNVFLEQIGLPIPAYPMLLVTGAMTSTADFSAAGLLCTAMLGALLADMFWFFAGRRIGRRVLGKLCRISLSPDSCVRQTESLYLKVGPSSLLFCKFVPGFASIAGALAGALGTRLWVFILFDALGAAIWAGSAILLGSLFDTAINELLDMLVAMGKWGAMLLALALAVFIAKKWWERYHFLKELRMARISVSALNEMIEGGMNPVIIDTRSAVQAEEGWIPGARFIGVDQLDQLGDDIDPEQHIILYCSCPNEVTAAKVAKAFMNNGYYKVRPLAGGIDAWAAAGYAVARKTPAPS